MACPFALEATMSNTTTPRVTVASTNARIDGIEAQLALILEALTAPKHATTSTVASEVGTKVEHVTPSKVRANTRTRKAKQAEAVIDCANVLSLADAQTAVDAGVPAWQVKVASSTTGKPIPYGLVLRANAAAERKAAKAEDGQAGTRTGEGGSRKDAALALSPVNKAMSKLMGKYTPAEWAVRYADADLLKLALADVTAAQRKAVKPFLKAAIEKSRASVAAK
jgi:hypothetical protein